MINNITDTHISNDKSILARYRRAENLEHEASNKKMVLNARIVHQWISESNSFWYRRALHNSVGSIPNIVTEYRLVDAEAATNVEAFDHGALATALANAANQTVEATSLPISNLEFDLEKGSVIFDAFDQRWYFDGDIKPVDSCQEQGGDYPAHWLISPNGEKAAFVKGYNLWVRNLESGEERVLTQDGEKYYAYAVQPESRDLMGDLYVAAYTPQPEAQWSPDSRQLFTIQTDERQVRQLPSMLYAPQDGTVAPKSIDRKYALPGDTHIAQYRLLIIDVATATETSISYSSLADSFTWLCPFSGNLAWWSGEGRYTYFVDMTRGQKTARLVKFDTQTKISSILLEENSSTYLELGLSYEYPSMLLYIPESNELIWPSERSGWWHLYRYDLNTGELKNAITTGEWLVRKVLHLDKNNRELWVQLAGRVEGRNPYYKEIARVNIDTGEMTILASSDHDYSIYSQKGMGFSSNNDFAVTLRSRVDEAPVTELRNREGGVVLTIETADTSGLPQGWQWPESVTTKADDGITDIYGVVFRPSDFDPNKKYPVLDFGMIAPMYSFLPTGAFLPEAIDEEVFFGPESLGDAYYLTLSAFAELGFIVTAMDGRGTPFRSKAFNDYGYGSFVDGGGLVDHVVGIKQLAERYQYMDLDRVGIVTTDAPSSAAVYGLLKYPDFYKVGVSFAPAQPELIRQGEVFYGILDETDRNPSVWHDMAPQLEGKLLVITGLLDTFFHAGCTFQLADALVKANKDFDLQIHPNGGHAVRVRNGHRRAWDYVVKHMQGLEPPQNFKLIAGAEKTFSGAFPEVLAENGGE